MGNLCSKSANSSDNFDQPGRRLGGGQDSTSPQQNRTSAPIPSTVVAGSPGRTLGGRREETSHDDPKSSAARAAEERAAKSNRPGGKLASELSKQRAKTQNQMLSEASRREVGNRTADELAQTRAYN